MNFQIILYGAIFILSSCVKAPNDETEYGSFTKWKFEECVIYLSNDSVIVLDPPDEYFYRVIDSENALVLQLLKNDQVVFSGRCTSTEPENHCNGQSCYETREYITIEGDTFHKLYGGINLHLLGEFPYNESNLTYELSMIPANLDVVTIWNYYSYVE